MIVRADGRRFEGRAVDLAAASGIDPGPETIAAAVRGEGSGLVVECESPGDVHEYVGLVTPATTVRVRTALAQAARSRGLSAPEDERRAEIEREIQAIERPETDAEGARRRIASVDDAEMRRLQERIAASRGALRERERTDGDVSEIRSRIAEAAAELSELRTERIAAGQDLDAACRRQREVRSRRDRRLRLEDRAANLARQARAGLVERAREDYRSALSAVPDYSPPEEPLDADGPAAALAIGRYASMRAPVVLRADGRFETAAAAADWLDAPVVRV